MRLFYYYWKDNNPAGRKLNCYRITSSWSENTATWNNQPTHYSTPTTYAYVPNITGEWMEWDVTSDVQKFVNGEKINYGWEIKDENYWGKPNIPITFFYSKENGELIPFLIVNNEAPNKPFRPFGPLFGRTKIPYIYRVWTKDPDGDNISYCFDWGDGNFTSTPFVPSGRTISVSHTWESTGIYWIRVKAQDEYDAGSEWSNKWIMIIWS